MISEITLDTLGTVGIVAAVFCGVAIVMTVLILVVSKAVR